MKMWREMGRFVPVVMVAGAAYIGFSLSTPVLDEIVWPETPVIEEVQAAAVDSSSGTAKAVQEEETSAVEESGVGDYEDGTYTGSGTGYSGTTKVEVIVKDRQITAVNILSYGDDDAFFNRAKGVIDSVLQKQTWEVDTVSEATYSSRGILEAIRNALTGSTEMSETKSSGETKAAISSSSFNDNASWKDGTYTGSAKGYGGSIYVKVTVKDGKIKSIDVTGHSGETDSYYNKATSIISKIISAQTPNVDTVSGATYSSNGIREAVKSALNKAAKGDTSKEETTKASETKASKKTTKKKTTKVKKGTPADGTYTGTAECSQFGYSVKLEAKFKDGKLVKLKNFELVGNEDTANVEFADQAWKTLKKTILKDPTTQNVDVVSGATYSSNAILEAYLNARNQAIKANGGTVEETTKSTKETTAKESTKAAETTARETVPANVGPKDGTYTAVGHTEKWDYDVQFKVVFADGKLSSLSDFTLLNNSSKLNVKFADNAWKGMSESLLADMSGNVDTISGATYTSDAILDAYLEVYRQAVQANGGTTEESKETSGEDKTQASDESGKNPTASGEDSTETKGSSEGTESGDTEKESGEGTSEESRDSGEETSGSGEGSKASAGETSGSGEESSDQDKEESESSSEETSYQLKDGTYTETAWCYYDESEDFDDYQLTVAITIKNDCITDIQFVSDSTNSRDNKDFYSMAISGVLSQKLSVENTKVNVVSGATCSSKALKECVAAALKEAKK